VQQLNETLLNFQVESDRKIAEMHFEFSTRMTILQQQQQTQGTIGQQTTPTNHHFQAIKNETSNNHFQAIKNETSNNSQDRIPILHRACLSLTSPAGPQPQLQGTLRVGGEKRVVTDDFTLTQAQIPQPPPPERGQRIGEKRCISDISI